MKNKKVIVIGAGLAGLSLATELADEGFDVTVLEKNSFLGGRASNTLNKKTHDAVPIGPHIFLNAYTNFLRFIKKIGASQEISWESDLFIDIVYKKVHDQWKRSRLPAPLYMLPIFFKYKFITLSDKLSNISLVNYIFLSSRQHLEELDESNTYDFLKSYGVSINSIEKLWRFFVLSMLNVPLELCSAAEFALLIKYWMQVNHGSIGFTKVGLGDMYVKNSIKYLKKKKAKIIADCEVQGIVFAGEKVKSVRVKINGEVEELLADIYISTMNPLDLRSALPEKVLFTDFFRKLNAYEGVPYISVNLWFDRKITNKKFWALLNDEETPKYLNTDFYDQSNIYKSRKKHSFITSNIIYSKPYEHLSDKEIVKKTLQELKEAFPRMEAKLTFSEVHRIPYVIYAPFPGVREHKLSVKTSYKNFYLAGDWVTREIPQCMEAAVRSGYTCAEIVLGDNGIKKRILIDRF